MILGRYYDLVGIHGFKIEPIQVLSKTERVGRERMTIYMKSIYGDMLGHRGFTPKRIVHRYYD